MLALHHLAFRTSDVVGLARFYQDWLGLRVVRDALPHALWLGLLGDAVLMLEAKAPSEPALAEASLELFAVRVSVDARLALRARLLRELRLEAETPHTLYFRDPDGRRVGVSSYEFAL